jgi:hypothetical protein
MTDEWGKVFALHSGANAINYFMPVTEGSGGKGGFLQLYQPKINTHSYNK